MSEAADELTIEAQAVDGATDQDEDSVALPDFLAYLRYEKERARGRSQARMLAAPPGRPGIDFVGRFENLNADFAEACARIGLDASLPHLNKTKHRDYREFYDEAARAYVAEAWADEIEEFGYAF